MRAARDRFAVEMAMRNRTAWNTAALCGMAMAGKLPRYEDVFPPRAARQQQVQTAEQQEVALRLLAAAWGAVEDVV